MHIDIPKGTIIKGNKELYIDDLVLKKDLKIPIEVKLSYKVNYPELKIDESEHNLEDLMHNIFVNLQCRYLFYGKEKNEKALGEVGLNLKNKILEIVEKVGD